MFEQRKDENKRWMSRPMLDQAIQALVIAMLR